MSWGVCLQEALSGDGLLCYVVLWHVLTGTLTLQDLDIGTITTIDRLWEHLKSSELYWKLMAFRDAAHEDCFILDDLVSEKEAIMLENFRVVATQRGTCPPDAEILSKLIRASTSSGRACLLAAMCAKKMKRDKTAHELFSKATTIHEYHEQTKLTKSQSQKILLID